MVDIQEDREINHPMPDFLETQIYAAFVSPHDAKMMTEFRDCEVYDLKYDMSKNFSDPTFLFPTPRPFLENRSPYLKKSLEIKHAPPEIHGIPNLSVPI